MLDADSRSGLSLLDQDSPLRVMSASRSLLKLPNLRAFLGLPHAQIERLNRAPADLYIGWGNKKSGQRARDAAQAAGRPFLLLEDAFIRSVRPQGEGGEPPIGICIDDRGIYYDCSAPSLLEAMIAEKASKSDALDASALIDRLRRERISKYCNFGIERLELGRSRAGGVLVVDQTSGDQSIIQGGASEKTFARMLEAARDENPGCVVIVKRHPETIAGAKRGCIPERMLAGCDVIAEHVDAWTLLAAVDKVYTVSSQLGFEAMLDGKSVRCFGMPFYAGWGLTKDESVCSRRKIAGLTAIDIAAAAYLRYARYVDPSTGQRVDGGRAIDILVERRRQLKRNEMARVFYGIGAWKRAAVRQMFDNTRRERKFFRTKRAAIAAARKRECGITVWASKIDEKLESRCRAERVPIVRLEDGFIRSVGLGARLTTAWSMVLDPLGIYYDSRRPSLLEDFLNTTEFTDEMLVRAKRLIDDIIQQDITKYNLSEPDVDFRKIDGARVILVPGQVDTDAAVRFSGSDLSALAHLKLVRDRNPDAYIIFKPHPDVVAGLRPGLSESTAALAYANKFVRQGAITRLIDIADEVHTISSLSGFEALIRRKPVHCYGLPFYAGWGLTHDEITSARRRRTLALEQLVAGALILYPHYIDVRTGMPCGPEVVLQRICDERMTPAAVKWSIRARRLLGSLRLSPPRI